MHFNTGQLTGNFVPENDSSNSSDMSSDSDMLSDSSSDSDTDIESNEGSSNANINQDSVAPGSSREGLTLNEEEEEDETIKAILRNTKLNRSHPPTIALDDFVVDICFHPQNDMIAVANILGDIALYKYTNETTELVSSIESHLKACRDIEFDHDGKILYSTAKDLSIMMTDVETEKLVRFYENAHEQPVYTMTILGEHTFATGDDDGVVKMWDIRQNGNTPVFSIKQMEDYVSAMITNKDNKYLVCASGDGSLTTFNMPAKKLHIQSEEYEEELLCLGLFKYETKVLTATIKGKMYVFNWGEFGLHSDEFPSLTKKALNCMIPITENIAITGGEDGMLRATSLFPHQHLGVVGQHNFPIEALDVNKDGTLIASSSHDNTIKFWNVEYLESLSIYEGIKGDKLKRIKHNLPSSKVDNASDFFADL
ncbi:PREDICTED: WD repeat-containing protein 55 homolog [Polistes dominula]|uniref:WD repeat-containing protein 55 homolog n=1 Tax=Polistes dominula TaxID=743375 RepID=A0ABM1J063_POLDO|nr:PREDICTED: WD repeat-containing protein 55 homolog [Polistes dominula]